MPGEGARLGLPGPVPLPDYQLPARFVNGRAPFLDGDLQGMMITYADCPPGEYTISYSGTSSDVEVYYEPDADLAVKFTASLGHTGIPRSS